jgi:hypothetical protein
MDYKTVHCFSLRTASPFFFLCEQPRKALLVPLFREACYVISSALCIGHLSLRQLDAFALYIPAAA